MTAGAGTTSQELGFLAIGYQVDSSVAAQLALVAGNQIALATGNDLIASTLPAKDEAAMQRKLSQNDPQLDSGSREVTLDTDGYPFSSVLLHGAFPSPLPRYPIMPLRPGNPFLH